MFPFFTYKAFVGLLGLTYLHLRRLWAFSVHIITSKAHMDLQGSHYYIKGVMNILGSRFLHVRLSLIFLVRIITSKAVM